MVLRVIRFHAYDGFMSNGDSIGPDHYRQRRILLPASGSSETRAQIPVFRQCAREVNCPSLTEPWRQCPYLFEASPGIPRPLRVTWGRFREENIPEFLSPAVLNALGLAAFNYKFRDDEEDRAESAASLRGLCVFIPPTR